MSTIEDVEEDRDLRKPFLHTGSWYKMQGLGSSQSSVTASAQILRDGSVSVILCVLIVALGPIQFGFSVSSNFRNAFFVYLSACLSEFCDWVSLVLFSAFSVAIRLLRRRT